MSEKESSVICVDNSEWMRNGDLSPTRMQCQQEAVNLVFQCKLRSNPENGVGLLSMADHVEVLSSMTREERKLYMKLYEVQIKGRAKILNAIKVAHLALRHRQNRVHKMRIVMFVGSPIEEMEKPEFIKLAKKLKKEKVNVDFVCFGEATSDDNQLLSEFVDTLNGKDGSGSNILVVSAGSKLTDALITSAVCRGDGNPINRMPTVGANGAVDFGVDADEDPELALALRVSLEEQRQRQRQENENREAEANKDAVANETAAEGNNVAETSSTSATNKSKPISNEDSSVFIENMSEEEQLAWALQMSVNDTPLNNETSAATTNDETMEVDENVGQLINNPELLQQIVDDISGNTEADANNKEDSNKDNLNKGDKR